jgi:hypothetical protein
VPSSRTSLTAAAGAPLSDPSEDPDNGVFQPAGLTSINAAAAVPPRHAAATWFGLYTFEFTPDATFTGSLCITAASVPSTAGTVAFKWYDTAGAIHTTAASTHPPTSAAITLRSPAPLAACCDGHRCAILPTPTACFARGGFLATGNTCGPTPTTTCCFADFNRDGQVGVQDVFDFITAYLTNSPAADVDGSGQVTVQDVFAFLAVYFAGCD